MPTSNCLNFDGMNGEWTPPLFITINIHIEKQTSAKRNECKAKCRTERNKSSSSGSGDKEKDDNDADDDGDEMMVNRRKYTRVSHTSTQTIPAINRSE